MRCMLFWVGLFSSSAVALDVTMSRYVLSVNNSAPLYFVDHPPIDSLCKDEDGCGVTLSLESTSSDVTVAAETRLRLALLADHFSWSSGANSGRDDDDVKNPVTEITGDSITCTFSDAEEGNADNAVGFSLHATGPNVAAAVCTLVLTD